MCACVCVLSVLFLLRPLEAMVFPPARACCSLADALCSKRVGNQCSKVGENLFFWWCLLGSAASFTRRFNYQILGILRTFNASVAPSENATHTSKYDRAHVRSFGFRESKTGRSQPCSRRGWTLSPFQNARPRARAGFHVDRAQTKAPAASFTQGIARNRL